MSGSILTVNQIQGTGLDSDENLTINLNGSIIHYPGTVLQVKDAELTAAPSGTITTSAVNSYMDPGLSLNITPTYSNSKMLIEYTIFMASGPNHYQTKSRIMRDSTPVGIGTSEGSRGVATSMINSYLTNSNTQYHINPHHNMFLDTPNTTSEITYKIQVASYSSSVTWYVNRSHTWQDGGTQGYISIPVSTLKVTEIGA